MPFFLIYIPELLVIVIVSLYTCSRQILIYLPLYHSHIFDKCHILRYGANKRVTPIVIWELNGAVLIRGQFLFETCVYYRKDGMLNVSKTIKGLELFNSTQMQRKACFKKLLKYWYFVLPSFNIYICKT